MKHTLIITSYLEGLDYAKEKIKKMNYTDIICADGGYNIAKKLDLIPSIVIGDFDSFENDNLSNESEASKNEISYYINKNTKSNIKVIKLPKEKDLTDTEAALQLAIDNKSEQISIIGGLGRRFDHTMGNIALLKKYAISNSALSIKIIDGLNQIEIVNAGNYELEKNGYKYIGLIPITDEISEISSKGLKYNLLNQDLQSTSTLGLSNEFTDETAKISFKQGLLMIVQTNDFL